METSASFLTMPNFNFDLISPVLIVFHDARAITFNSTTTDGPSPLRLHWPGFVYPVKLSDPEGNPIPCNAASGEVTVIPEFPLILMVFSLVLMTMTITLLKKRQIACK